MVAQEVDPKRRCPTEPCFALGELLGAGVAAQLADMVPAIDFAHGEVGVSGGTVELAGGIRAS
jgi:hypothetical protein